MNFHPSSFSRLAERARALPSDLAASLLTIASFFIFTWMGVLARAASQTLPVIEIVFLRQVMATLLLAPLFWRVRAQIRHPQKPFLHLARGVAASVAMVSGISAVVHIPFADATAIQMAEVLFITALAALVLKEKVGWRRWTATGVGFLGVIVMLRPFSGSIDPFALVALLGAAFGGLTVISIRLAAAYDSVSVVLFYQGLLVLVLLAGPAAYYWVPPTSADLMRVGLMSVVFVVGQLLFTQALRMGRAAALAPLHYIRLLLMSVVGYWLYDEVPTLATAIGALLIVGATTYTLRRNAIRQVPPTPPAPAP